MHRGSAEDVQVPEGAASGLHFQKLQSRRAALTRKSESLAHEFEYSPIISQLIDSERRPGRCEQNDHFLSGLQGLSPYHRSARNHRTFEVQVGRRSEVPKLQVKN
jgi:hypothetical protein